MTTSRGRSGDGRRYSEIFRWFPEPVENRPGVSPDQILSVLVTLLITTSAFTAGISLGTGVATASYQAAHSKVCTDVEESNPWSCVSETYTFSTTDAEANVWLRLEDVTASHDVEWKWYTPSGSHYGTATFTIPDPGTQGFDSWSTYTTWSTLPIDGDRPAEVPGTWEVRTFVDGNRVSTHKVDITSDVDGDLTIDVKHDNGDRSDEVNGLVVWQDEVGGEPYKKVTNYPGLDIPYTFSNLPAGHDYKVNAYINDQFADGTGWVSISAGDSKSRQLRAEQVTLQVQTFHSDGNTPLEDATVKVWSHERDQNDGDETFRWRQAQTNAEGYIEASQNRFWLHPTDSGYYVLEVFYGGTKVYSDKLDTLNQDESLDITTPVSVPEYSLSVSAGDGGSVSLDPSNGPYEKGTTVDVVANPDSGFVFDHWSGDYPSGQRTDRSITVGMDSDKSLTAHFEQGHGDATVSVEYADGSTVDEVNAYVVWQDRNWEEPYAIYENWDEFLSNPKTFSDLPAGHEYLITAYVNDQHVGDTGLFTLDPGDSVSKTVQSPDQGSIEPTVYYSDGTTPLEGATVRVESHEENPDVWWRSAPTDAHGSIDTSQGRFLLQPLDESTEDGYYRLSVFHDGNRVGSKRIDNLDPGQNRKISVTTSAEVQQHTLQIDVRFGDGQVRLDPPGELFGDQAGRDYPEGTEVTVTAEPADGFVFHEWASGHPSGQKTAQSFTVVMDSDRTIVANFERGEGNLTIDAAHESGGQASEVNGLLIYQDQVDSDHLYREVHEWDPDNDQLIDLPHEFSALPAGHQYLVTVYINDQLAGSTDWIPIEPGDSKARSLTVNDSVWVRPRILHRDGVTPLQGAVVKIWSHEKNQSDGDKTVVWRSGETDGEGYVTAGLNGGSIPEGRLWLYPTSADDPGYYLLKVFQNGEPIAQRKLDDLDTNRELSVVTDAELETDPREFQIDTLEVNGEPARRIDDLQYFRVDYTIDNVSFRIRDAAGEPVVEEQLTLTLETEQIKRVDGDIVGTQNRTLTLTHCDHCSTEGIYNWSAQSMEQGGDAPNTHTRYVDVWIGVSTDGPAKHHSIPISSTTDRLRIPVEGWVAGDAAGREKVVVDGETYYAIRIQEELNVDPDFESAWLALHNDGRPIADDQLAHKVALTASVSHRAGRFRKDDKIEKWNEIAESYRTVRRYAEISDLILILRNKAAELLGTVGSTVLTGGTSTVAGMTVKEATIHVAEKLIRETITEYLQGQTFTKSEILNDPIGSFEKAMKMKARAELAESARQAEDAATILENHPDGEPWTWEEAHAYWEKTNESALDGVYYMSIRTELLPSAAPKDQLIDVTKASADGAGIPVDEYDKLRAIAELIRTGEFGFISTATEERAETRLVQRGKRARFDFRADELRSDVVGQVGTDNVLLSGEAPAKNALIEITSAPSGSFTKGDEVVTEVRVTNTGTEPSTYFVGYSVATEVDGSDEFFDNHGTTGHFITLESGESRTTNVTWFVQSDVPKDQDYDVLVAVWPEFPASGMTPLDRSRNDNAFSVSQGANFEVLSVQQVTESPTVGEPVSFAVTVENTGHVTGETLVTLKNASGIVIDSEIERVDPGQQSTGLVTTKFDSPGEKTVIIEGQTIRFDVAAAPFVSDVSLDNDGDDNLELSFRSAEPLHSITVTVDGPSSTDIYTFDETDFSESGNGPYTYSLTTSQPFDAGDGTYSATIDDAIDGAGNNGGENGLGSGLTDSYTLDTTGNQKPIAEANGPYQVGVGQQVPLDSSGSEDPDGTVQTVSWTVVTGPGFVENGAYHAPDQTPDETSATVELTVTDNDGASATDTATVDIDVTDPSPPVDGFEDGDINEYSGQTDGFKVQESVVNDGQWALKGQVQSGDNKQIHRTVGLSQPTKLQGDIRVGQGGGNEDAIIAYHENDINGAQPISIHLAMNHGNSGFGDTSGEAVLLVNGKEIISAFYDRWYSVELKEIDWSGQTVGEVYVNGSLKATNVDFAESASSIDTLRLSVADWGDEPAWFDDISVGEVDENRKPIAKVGVNQTVTAGETVSMDASGSSDPDGDSLTYSWVLVDGPSVSLDDPNSPSPSFTAPSVDSETQLTFELTVSDGELTDTDTVTVSVTPPESDLAGRWTFDGDGSSVQDQSGNGHTGTIVGDPARVDGVSDDALQFDGQDDFVRVDMTPTLQTTGSFTLALWVNATAEASGTALGLYTYEGNGQGEGLNINVGASSAGFHARHSSGFGGSGDPQDPYYHTPDNPTISPGEWHHLALVYDDANETISFYVDGEQTFETAAPKRPRVDDSYLAIGARPHRNQPASHLFTGSVDDVRVYSRALARSELPTGEKADSDSSIAPFSAVVQPATVAPESLAGVILVEDSVNDGTSVELVRNSSANYTLTLTAPDSADNVTFYLQTQAVSSSQDIANLTMYLDGEEHEFVVNESAGPGDSAWIAFNVPEFSTRTVSFVDESTDSTPPMVTVERPANGTRFPAGTEEVTINATYADSGSGVNTSNVQLLLNGTDITSQASVTDSYVTATLSGLDNNTSHTLTVVVTDFAGNENTTSTEFQIQETELMSAERIIEDRAPPGGNVTVTVEIHTLEAVDGPAVDEDLPESLSLVAESTDPSGGTSRPSEHQWLWLDAPADATLTVTYTVQIPDSATVGDTFELSGTVSSTNQDPITIMGESKIKVGTCIDRAVAGGDRQIGLREIQLAINWWAEDTPVPDTGGQTIGLQKIQSLINGWAEDRTIACG